MRLVYTATGQNVSVGDVVTVRDRPHTVGFFRPPSNPASSGKVTVWPEGNRAAAREYFVSVIGAEWIDREDRP
jgi:hypothetical protein